MWSLLEPSGVDVEHSFACGRPRQSFDDVVPVRPRYLLTMPRRTPTAVRRRLRVSVSDGRKR